MSESRKDRLDAATAARLAKLRQTPVDTGALRAGFEAALDRETQPMRLSLWRRPMWRIAAMLLLAGGALGVAVLSMMPREAVASVEQFAVLHQEMQAMPQMMTPVTDMAGAERMLKQQWQGAPDMPEGVPHEQMACCVHQVAGKKAAVVTIRGGAAPITMAVTDAKQVAIPRVNLSSYRGREYSVGTARGVNMVMFERAGKSVCIMGNAATDELLQLADAVRF